jgi:hypothetical protein
VQHNACDEERDHAQEGAKATVVDLGSDVREREREGTRQRPVEPWSVYPLWQTHAYEPWVLTQECPQVLSELLAHSSTSVPRQAAPEPFEDGTHTSFIVPASESSHSASTHAGWSRQVSNPVTQTGSLPTHVWVSFRHTSLLVVALPSSQTNWPQAEAAAQEAIPRKRGPKQHAGQTPRDGTRDGSSTQLGDVGGGRYQAGQCSSHGRPGGPRSGRGQGSERSWPRN